MNELTARHTFAFEDAEYELFMVVFAEEEGEQGERLDIQRAFAFDDQDRSLGQDTYCLVSREGVSYGAITSWSLTGKVLTLALDETCSEALAADGGYVVGALRELGHAIDSFDEDEDLERWTSYGPRSTSDGLTVDFQRESASAVWWRFEGRDVSAAP